MGPAHTFLDVVVVLMPVCPRCSGFNEPGSSEPDLKFTMTCTKALKCYLSSTRKVNATCSVYPLYIIMACICVMYILCTIGA